ncbi:MAG: hypothetical protein DWQ31_11750 [Planctomycetota bacterium]|nr:MAG: hypothetical protein DWQ31_11750 [Planctomycetota bacterium]
MRPYLAGLDLRSIGLFRIVAGLAMFLDVLVFKFPSFEHIYSRHGFFADVYAAQHRDGRPIYLNLFYDLGSDAAVRGWFAFVAAVYLLYALGLWPRLLAPLSWLLFCVTRESNSLLDFSTDLWLLSLMFWALFLPQGARFRLFHRGLANGGENELRSYPAFLMLASIALVYFTNGYAKLGGDWLTGEALHYFVAWPATRSWASSWLLDQPRLLVLLEYGTIVWELIFPLLLFFPYFNQPLRWFAVVSVLAFHYGNLPFIFPGYYCVVATCIAAILLPSSFWALLRREATSEPEQPSHDVAVEPQGSPRAVRYGRQAVLVLRNLLLTAIFLFALALNLERLPVVLGLREKSWGVEAAATSWHANSRRTWPQVDMLRFLLTFHTYYPAEIPEHHLNLLVFGLDANGHDWNLVSGEPANEAYWGPSPDFQRPYFALHRAAHFQPQAFIRFKIFERWLEKLTDDWNRSHPDRPLVRSLLAMAELDGEDPENPVKNVVDLARWQSEDARR